MYNTCNIPATPLNNAHPGGFFYLEVQKEQTEIIFQKIALELTKRYFLRGSIPWYIFVIYVPTIVVYGIGRLPLNPRFQINQLNGKEFRILKYFVFFLIFKKLIIIPGEWEYFKNNLLQLLKEYDDIDIKRMGFPVDWEDRINSI